MLLVSILIDETMTNWSKLQHAYGSAVDLPAFLGALSPNAEDPVWDELWGRVCHQGTVYSASAPVLPYLLSAAREWPPVARVTPLSLAGAIVISPNVSGSHDLQPHRSTIEGLHRLATETTASIGLSSTDFIYLLQAVLALEGDLLWGSICIGSPAANSRADARRAGLSFLSCSVDMDHLLHPMIGSTIEPLPGVRFSQERSRT